MASRICLNLLGSARARRERYVGQWIPEPLPDPAEWSSIRPGAAADPPDRVTLDESVSMAVYAFEIAGGRITRMWAVLNPGKLRPWLTG